MSSELNHQLLLFTATLMSKTDQLKSKLKSVLIPDYPSFSGTTDGSKTPKTPADEGIDFFESAFNPGEKPIQVYELQLDPDGGPNKDRSVEYLLVSVSGFQR